MCWQGRGTTEDTASHFPRPPQNWDNFMMMCLKQIYQLLITQKKSTKFLHPVEKISMICLNNKPINQVEITSTAKRLYKKKGKCRLHRMLPNAYNIYCMYSYWMAWVTFLSLTRSQTLSNSPGTRFLLNSKENRTSIGPSVYDLFSFGIGVPACMYTK